ncbi:putative ubiquitin ligase, partial [Plasmodium yoelii yoelii]
LTLCVYENKNPDFLNLSQYNEIKNYFINLTKNSENYDNINNVLINTIDQNISTISRNEVYLNSIPFRGSRSSGSINENQNMLQNNTLISSISGGYINTMANRVGEADEAKEVDEADEAKEVDEVDEFDCIDLIPNGRNINVNNENKELYIKLYIDYKYNKLIQKKTQHFLKGLSQLIPVKWLKLFSAHELKILISGNDKCFDVNDLRNNVTYSGGYNENSKTIINLFEILNNFTPNEKSLFLIFVTSCSRSPLLGFKELYPKFCIARVPDNTRLPTSSTCVNLLKLPDYETKEILYQNLITAINGTQGFDLS